MFCVSRNTKQQHFNARPEPIYIYSSYNGCFRDFQHNDQLHVKEFYLTYGLIPDEKVFIKLVAGKTSELRELLKKTFRAIAKKDSFTNVLLGKQVVYWRLQFTRKQALKLK